MAKEGPDGDYDADPLNFFGLNEEKASSKPFLMEEDSDEEELPLEPLKDNTASKQPITASKPISMKPSTPEISQLASFDSCLLMQYKSKESLNTEMNPFQRHSSDFKKPRIHPSGM